MADTVDKATRSKIMSSIKGSGTKMELAARPLLESMGFEYHPQGVFGKPDFASQDLMVALFLDGCWWHGCPKHYKAPESNSEFWAQKVERNRTRDRAVTQLLKDSGWTVWRVWEHDANDLERLEVVLSELKNERTEHLG